MDNRLGKENRSNPCTKESRFGPISPLLARVINDFERRNTASVRSPVRTPVLLGEAVVTLINFSTSLFCPPEFACQYHRSNVLRGGRNKLLASPKRLLIDTHRDGGGTVRACRCKSMSHRRNCQRCLFSNSCANRQIPPTASKSASRRFSLRSGRVVIASTSSKSIVLNKEQTNASYG